MKQIGNVIISDEVWQTKFACDLNRCHGKCCQFGDLGAPVSEEEIETIQKYLARISPLLPPANIKFLENGISEIYEGTLHIREMAANTPCPLAFIDKQGCVLCSLHSYALEKKLPILQIKPLWCSLFPLIIKKSGNNWVINCHIPEFCRSTDNPSHLLLSFDGLLENFFGSEWIEDVKKEYLSEEKMVK